MTLPHAHAHAGTRSCCSTTPPQAAKPRVMCIALDTSMSMYSRGSLPPAQAFISVR